MEVTHTQVDKYLITNVHGLDPISAILEDIKPGVGKLTITCWDSAWSYTWGAMGDRNIRSFILGADNYYLSKKLSNERQYIIDYDKISEDIKENVDSEWEMSFHLDKIEEKYGPDWCHELPEKYNPKHEYLHKILDTIKEAIKNENL